eukprot:g9225.t1
MASRLFLRKTLFATNCTSFLRCFSKRSAIGQIQELLKQNAASKEGQRPTLELYVNRVAKQLSTGPEVALSDLRRVLYVCSKLRKEPESVLEHLLEKIRPELLQSAKSTDLSLILYSLSVFHRRRWLFVIRKLRDEVLETIMMELNQPIRIQELNSVDLTQVLYSLASLERKEVKLINGIANKLTSTAFVDTLKGRECANLLWAFTKLGYMDHVALVMVSKRTVSCWKTMTNREKAMTSYSWGMFGQKFRSYLLSSLHMTFDDETRPLSFELQQLSAILVSLARLKMKKEDVLIGKIMTRVVESMKRENIGEQGLSNIVWSLGQLGYKNATHLDLLVSKLTKPRMLPRFTCQGVCNLFIGLALLQLEDLDSIEILVQEVLEPARLPFFNNQELAMLNWSLGKLSFQRMTLLDKLITTTSQTHKIKEYSIEEISAILTGWVGVKMSDQLLIFAFVKEALSPRRLPGINAQDLSIIIWAMGNLDFKQTQFCKLIFLQLYKDNRIAQLQPHGFRNALIGFHRMQFDNHGLESWVRKVLNHWNASGKLHNIKKEDLKFFVSLLSKFKHIDPGLVSHFSKELTQKESLEYSIF